MQLIDRIEAAAGGSRELDAEIRLAVDAPPDAYLEQSKINGAWVIYHGTEFRSGRPRIWVGDGSDMAYTTSLDAAMSLVPEGWVFGVETTGKGARAAVDQIEIDENVWYNRAHKAATPALALVAAALTARGVS